MWLPADLYETISLLPNSHGNWSIESLAPIPLLSIALDKCLGADLNALLEWLGKHSLRGVCVIASVKHGTIGKGIRFSHGSTGSIMPILLEAAIVLDKSVSWIDAETALLLNRAIDGMVKEDVKGYSLYQV